MSSALPAARDWSHPAFDHYSGAGLFIHDWSLSLIAGDCRGRLCYLATPYTKVAVSDGGDWCPSASSECSSRAAQCARDLAREGVTAVSPIIQAVEMIHADLINLAPDPLDDDFWARWCWPLLRVSDVVIVPTFEGWAESDGIWAEVRVALATSRRVFLMNLPNQPGDAR